MDLVGSRFMNKLGFTLSQYNPKTGTIVKGVDGIGLDANNPHLYVYEPIGTTGADTDVADAIINTSFSAEDNPNSDARGGLGQLIYYPSSADNQSNQIRHTTSGAGSSVPSGVRYDWSYTLYGQRGGLKTNNHNKSMGFPNIVGTPQVEDVLTFPLTLNPDGEQRTGYTIEIGSNPLRAVNLPIKLTDGYYYILCPDLIDDPQFYISNNNGSVIPAIAIVSKTYVSGDFYTTFQSPIRFYCKKNQILTKIKVQIRNSSMGVPSNLGANSSVIFSINRFSPTIQNPPLDIGSQQAVDYAVMDSQKAIRQKNPTALSTLGDISQLVNDILRPNDNQADYLGALQQRINNYDIVNMNPEQRRTFYATPEGGAIRQEMGHVLALGQDIQNQENNPLQDLVAQQNQQSDRFLHAIRESARQSYEQQLSTMNIIGEQPIPDADVDSGNYMVRNDGILSGSFTRDLRGRGMGGMVSVTGFEELGFNTQQFDTQGLLEEDIGNKPEGSGTPSMLDQPPPSTAPPRYPGSLPSYRTNEEPLPP